MHRDDWHAHPQVPWLDDDPLYAGPVSVRELVLEGVTLGFVLFAIACALFGLSARLV